LASCQLTKNKAIIVVAHALIVIISLAHPATKKPYHELGVGYFTRRLDPGREPAA